MNCPHHEYKLTLNKFNEACLNGLLSSSPSAVGAQWG